MAPAVRGRPIHRLIALAFLAGMALPAGFIKVSFGDIWSADPPLVHLLLAGAQIFPLWWIGRWPVHALAIISGFFLIAQAFAWPATTADLSIFVALAIVGARVRRRTAIMIGAAVTVALAVFMVAAQAPAHPEAVGEALFPAAMIISIPVLIGMSYQGVRRQPGPPAAAYPQVEPASADAAEPGATAPRSHDGPPLTARELVILNLVARGLTNPEIATELTIGRETVKTHIGNILAKLGARDRTHAVTVAYRNRLIDDR